MNSGDPAPSSPSDRAAAKARLREEALARRAALSEEERAVGSAAVSRILMNLALESGTTVSAYLPIRGEVDLGAAISGLHDRGHPVGLPAMMRGGLGFRRFSPGAPLVPLGFGTVGPGPEAEEIVPDVLLMPLSAFDARGGRIGYGRGYYDRTIARLVGIGRNPRLIGIAFSVQEVGAVPMEPHDRPLHMIVTEKGAFPAA